MNKIVLSTYGFKSFNFLALCQFLVTAVVLFTLKVVGKVGRACWVACQWVHTARCPPPPLDGRATSGRGGGGGGVGPPAVRRLRLPHHCSVEGRCSSAEEAALCWVVCPKVKVAPVSWETLRIMAPLCAISLINVIMGLGGTQR